MIKDVYPLTIISDRYNGTYSGAKYTAWNLRPYEVPRAVGGSDIECHDFWTGADPDSYEYKGNHVIGMGSTIQEAKDDLVRKMQKAYDEAAVGEICSKFDTISYQGKKDILNYMKEKME